ncbi:hypothetical protein CY0110_16542 [Crocosphaera chwakensis CCY0110]|uniref:Uncharacterized protein n=1 Tax=Crocosphaera chwakensis CCY0110 TaxID=391612 RepID=A3IHZ0_9CHRO|nr:hypothetical protein CY0110_16542 [Crocosphaera chwakensis CCY0110]
MPTLRIFSYLVVLTCLTLGQW